MRILLIGNYPPDKQESMLRYAALLERELTAHGHTVRLMQPQPFLARSRSGPAGLGKWLGYVDKFVLFPAALRGALPSFEVVHICDHSNSMYAKYLSRTPHVVTCHDVLAIRSALGEVPENSVSATGRMLQRMILDGLRAAQYVVCVSKISRAEMLRVTGRPEYTSEVVYNSLGYPYTPMPPELAMERLSGLGYDARIPFFLHVGGSSWYKNRLGVVQIYDHLRRSPQFTASRLLFIGGPFGSKVSSYLHAAGLHSQITRLSDLTNEDLRAAYSLAQGLIFPSLQEGFGWPVLEAQSCGCPVFTTGRDPMTEVGGQAAIYFNPADPAAAAAIIAAALPDRRQICLDGLANAKRFSVDTMVECLQQAYERVLAASKYT